jgi:hypothetical protein
MPPGPLLDAVPLWVVFAGTAVSILLAAEGGYRAGLWRRARTDQEKEGPVGGLVAAELGLLAFLLAFTFGIAASRFDERLQLVIEEANDIGTTYLRAAMLREPHRTKARRLLREYVAVRVEGVQSGAVEDAIRRSEELQGQLWSEATAAADKDPRSVPVGLFIQATNETIDVHTKRLQAGLWSRVPITVWGVLFAVAVLSFTSLGYHGGLAGTRRSPAVLAVAVTFAVVLWLVVDLERPSEGLLRVSQQPMIELQKSMAASRP